MLLSRLLRSFVPFTSVVSYATCSPGRCSSGGKGWLSDIINHFGECGGFDAIKRRTSQHEGLNIEVLGNLMRPFKNSAGWLNEKVYEDMLKPFSDLCFDYVGSISGELLKTETKNIERNDYLRSIVNSLKAVRKRAAVPGQVDKAVGALFLGTLLKIIRGDSFNGVMYSLNELKRIINEIQCGG